MKMENDKFVQSWTQDDLDRINKSIKWVETNPRRDNYDEIIDMEVLGKVSNSHQLKELMDNLTKITDTNEFDIGFNKLTAEDDIDEGIK